MTTVREAAQAVCDAFQRKGAPSVDLWPAIVALRRALAAPQPAAAPWMPFSSAPKDGAHILAFWPLHPFDDDDEMDTSKVVGGIRAVTFRSGDGWVDPDYLDATGAWFGDDCCYAAEPTHWMPLPTPPGASHV